MKRLDIIELQQHAINRNGKLLSIKYKNNRNKLLWQCENKHIWAARYENIKNGTWCPECYKNTFINILTLQQYAINKGGKLLSTDYKNSFFKLEWECEKKHVWESSWSNIHNNNTWCPKCSHSSRVSFLELQQHAISKGGNLVSTEYKNNKEKLIWQCSNSHIWKATWGDIKNLNSWCPVCAKNNKPNITELQQHAINKGGKLLSTTYINCNIKMLWKCKEAHSWEARWVDIKHKNSWCPVCANMGNKSELECRLILEKYFNKSFPNTRIFYDKNKFIELDCYNEELKIALEYNGEQHYKYVKIFHRGTKTLKKQQLTDLFKIEYCQKNNIKLIIVPYTENKRLEEFILGQLSTATQ